MRLRNGWVCALGLAVALSAAACGGSKESDDDLLSGGGEAGGAAAPAGGSGGGQKVDAATAGSVTGTVALDGAAPANQPIRMNADPVCAKEAKGEQLQETIVVGPDGKSLANVLVYVKDGLGAFSYDAPTETAKLDQKECRYRPHVLAVRVGQPVDIINSDPTLHNIHATGKANAEFNNGQPIQGMKMTHTFTAKEVVVPFKCDVHGWMNAYAAVLDHPFFAVTGPDGKFELKGLPPGTYTIEAWQEKLGTTTQSVTIGAKEAKEVAFSFKPAAAATN
jgi:plastocyanin